MVFALKRVFHDLSSAFLTQFTILAQGVEPRHLDFEWEDVTAQFTAASESLKIGEIIAPANFSLHEAMSAIELMDPKMDIGLGSANVLTLVEIEARGRLPDIETLSPANWLSLMDSLIVAEQMHYEGFHLAQCLLTCYYVHDLPRKLEKCPLLANFVRVLFRRCGLIRDCILVANNYFEEDFVHYNFGFSNLDIDPKESEIKDLTTKLIADEEARLKTLKEDDQDRKIGEAILLRLKWNYAMYLAQLHLSTPLNAGLPLAEAFINESIEYLNGIKETASLAENPEKSTFKTAGGSDVIVNDGNKNATSVKIFEYEIMRRWTNATPPTIQPWKSLEQSMVEWRSVLELLLSFTKLPSVITCFRDAKEILTELVVDKKAPLLPRARYLNIVWNDHKFLGKISLNDMLIQDITEQYGLTTKYVKADEKTLAFHLDLCETGITDVFRSIGVTRSRARRRLPHIFENWETLLGDGDVLDAKIAPILKFQREEERCRGFARWHVDMIQSMISDYLSIGFELQLYEKYEAPMIFWYLDNLAAARQKSHFKVLESLEIHKHMSLQAATSKRTAGKNSKAGSSAAAPLPTVEVKNNWYAVELDAKFQLTRALFLLIASFDAAGFFALPRTAVSSPQTRYFLRFHSLLNLNTPSGLRFEHFQTSYLDIVRDRSPSDLLQRATKAAQAAIRAFMTLSKFSQPDPVTSKPITPPPTVIKEANALMQVALKNGMTIARLIQSNQLDACKTLKEAKTDNEHNKPSSKPTVAGDVPNNSSHFVDLDFSAHRAFPLITLKTKEAPKTN